MFSLCESWRIYELLPCPFMSYKQLLHAAPSGWLWPLSTPPLLFHSLLHFPPQQSLKYCIWMLHATPATHINEQQQQQQEQHRRQQQHRRCQHQRQQQQHAQHWQHYSLNAIIMPFLMPFTFTRNKRWRVALTLASLLAAQLASPLYVPRFFMLWFVWQMFLNTLQQVIVAGYAANKVHDWSENTRNY